MNNFICNRKDFFFAELSLWLSLLYIHKLITFLLFSYSLYNFRGASSHILTKHRHSYGDKTHSGWYLRPETAGTVKLEGVH